MSRADEIKKLIYERQRRIQILKEKEARFGISTPPEILLEIEDIEAKIEELQRELSLLSQDSQFTLRTKPIEQFEEENMQRGVKKQTGNLPHEQAMPSIGLVTALPKEFAAVKALLEDARDVTVPGRGAGRRYLSGNITTIDGTTHALVLALAGMGTNSAAARAARILDHFSTINSIIMVGIAGGIPYPEKPDEHVRLGDVVVSNMGGVVQYDFGKEERKKEEVITVHRHPPRPPSATLLEAVDLLEVYEIEEERPWLKFISQIMDRLKITRPPDETDILVSSKDPNQQINHPDDSKRTKGQPRIFKGPIASANTLLKNPIKRDKLRNKFGVKAVEMEGSGIADAAWNYEVGYLIVRGICDYCDSKKGDEWQAYAAAVAAGYVGALLESTLGTHIIPKPITSSPKEQSKSLQKRNLSTLPKET